MRGINKVILVGTCGRDPEIRYLPNGTAVANVSLATSESWNDRQSGQKVEKTEWHRVVLFGKVAEIAGEYLRKGSQCYIEGKLKTREWEQDGIKRYSTEVHVDINGTLQLLGGRSDNQGGGQQQQRQPQQQRQQPRQQQRQGATARTSRPRRRTTTASTTTSRSPHSTTWRAHDRHHVSAGASREVRGGHGQVHWSALGRIPRKQASTGGHAVWHDEKNAH